MNNKIQLILTLLFLQLFVKAANIDPALMPFGAKIDYKKAPPSEDIKSILEEEIQRYYQEHPGLTQPNEIKLTKYKSKLIGKKLLFDKDELKYAYNSVRESSLPKPYRIIKPGDLITLDLNPNRLNLKLNDKNIIVEIGYY